MNKKWVASTLALMLTMGIGAGCAKQEEAAPVQPEQAKSKIGTNPITLSVFTEVPMSPDDFEKLIAGPVKAKYPSVTLERSEKAKGNEITDRIAAGTIPDILLSGFYFIPNLTDTGMLLEIDDRIKQNNVDLSAFEPVVIDALKGFRDGKLVALPFYMGTTALFYNKDIFDRFGVPYPKDGMTWNEATELARKLTRSDGGVNYQGLNPGSWDTLGSQLSLQKIDPATNKAMVNSDGYRKVLTLLQDINSIPNIDPKMKAMDAFTKDRNLAMYSFWWTDVVTKMEEAAKAGSPGNWDIVSTPTFQDKPGVGAKVDAHILMVSSQTKYKDEAFEIIKFLTTSPEVQTEVAKTGRIPVQTNKEIRKHLGENYQSLKGKNLDAIFKNKMAPLPKFHVLDSSAVGKPMGDAVTAVTQNNVDINTALRQAEEAVNKNIEQLMKK
ncbi:ABC transporter substrate-binding protein [Paenibacillus sp. UNC451MF]|uniref:ABC transporter substrate-binding protein n=1 Tax=Paenibacillus sp. UNC451MF TaxID=1449063 RepID=UPI00048C88E7|nr:extracellular solute-binding protein [Paenibacillus sp. UNC451MF]